MISAAGPAFPVRDHSPERARDSYAPHPVVHTQVQLVSLQGSVRNLTDHLARRLVEQGLQRHRVWTIVLPYGIVGITAQIPHTLPLALAERARPLQVTHDERLRLRHLY